MATSYMHLNEFGQQVTEQQFHQLSNKYLVYKEDGVIVKEEEFENEEVIYTEYYISPGEDHSSFLSLDNSCGIIELEHIGVYSKEIGYKYKDGALINKSITIENENEEIIFSERININTDLPVLRSLKKYYFDNLNDREYEFLYGSDDCNLKMIICNEISKYNSYVIRPSEIPSTPNFEWWEEHSTYYLNASPMIPA